MTPKTPALLAGVALLATATGCATTDPNGCPTEVGATIHDVAGVLDVGLACERQVVAGRLTFAAATEEQLSGAVESTLKGLAATGLADDWVLRVTYVDERGLMAFNASAAGALPADPTLGLVRRQLDGATTG